MHQEANEYTEINGIFDSRDALMNALEEVSVAHDHHPKSDGSFHSQITRRRFGRFIFGDLRIDPCTSSRGPGYQKSATEEYFCLTALPVGAVNFAQKNVEFTVGAGEVFAWNANLPSVFDHNIRCIGKTIMIPIGLAEQKIRDARDLIGLKTISGDPLSNILYSHLIGLHDNIESLPNDRVFDVVMSTLDLAVSCLPSSPFRSQQTPYQKELFRRAVDHIMSRLSDEDLTLTSAANEIGISARSLQKVFTSADTSFGEFLRNARLSAAAKALNYSPMGKASITEIAYRFGFYDLSHFSSLFKRKYGMSPSAFRAKSA